MPLHEFSKNIAFLEVLQSNHGHRFAINVDVDTFQWYETHSTNWLCHITAVQLGMKFKECMVTANVCYEDEMKQIIDGNAVLHEVGSITCVMNHSGKSSRLNLIAESTKSVSIASLLLIYC